MARPVDIRLAEQKLTPEQWQNLGKSLPQSRECRPLRDADALITAEALAKIDTEVGNNDGRVTQREIEDYLLTRNPPAANANASDLRRIQKNAARFLKTGHAAMQAIRGNTTCMNQTLSSVVRQKQAAIATSRLKATLGAATALSKTIAGSKYQAELDGDPTPVGATYAPKSEQERDAKQRGMTRLIADVDIEQTLQDAIRSGGELPNLETPVAIVAALNINQHTAERLGLTRMLETLTSTGSNNGPIDHLLRIAQLLNQYGTTESARTSDPNSRHAARVLLTALNDPRLAEFLPFASPQANTAEKLLAEAKQAATIGEALQITGETIEAYDLATSLLAALKANKANTEALLNAFQSDL